MPGPIMLALMAAPVSVALLVVALRTGGLRALLTVRLRHTWLVGVAAAVQVVRLTEPAWATAVLTPLRGALPAVLMWSLLAAFVLGNLRGRSPAARAGFLTFLAGTTMNSAAIVANGGMPFSVPAARWAGFTEAQIGTHLVGHPPLTRDSRLVPLADVIPVPVLPAVASVGDLLIFAGLSWLLIAVTARRAAGPPPGPGNRPTPEGGVTHVPAPHPSGGDVARRSLGRGLRGGRAVHPAALTHRPNPPSL